MSQTREFRWNYWNVDHIGEHGVSQADAEWVVRHASPPYPHYEGDGKYIVRGQAEDGQYLQVVYVFSPADVIYIIHPRPLTDREKRRLRRSKP